MLVPSKSSKYIKTQAERLNVLPAFIYVESEPDFVLAASVSGANLATELCCQQQVYLILMGVQTENRENGLILNYSQLTGSHLDIDEGRRELRRTDKDGKQVSYDPPRYEYSYNFDFTITVNTPYFDEMSFRLNPRPIILESEAPSVFSLVRSIDPSYNIEYRRYIQLADEMRAAVDQARAVSHAAPTANRVQNIPTPAASVEWICPACGGSNTGKFCEYCGTPRP